MDLHLNLRDAPGRSKRERCEHALRAAVRRLPAGARLPPTRALATQLGVSRGVVVEAYAQLAAEGYLLTRRGGGTFVAGSSATPFAPAAARPAVAARSCSRTTTTPSSATTASRSARSRASRPTS